MGIKIISLSGIQEILPEDITVSQIGQKALGLMGVPQPWRLPFACLSSEIFAQYCKSTKQGEKEVILLTATSYINQLCSNIGVDDGDQIIIRSSGVEEGMQARGQFETENCAKNEIKNTLYKIFEEINRTAGDNTPQIGFVIQKFIPDAILGHLSNERRFSAQKRDWVYEYKTKLGDIVSDKIGVRVWRKQLENAENVQISCFSEDRISDALYAIACYYTKKKATIHLEFLWDGSRIIVAQADYANYLQDGLVDPTSFPVKVNHEQFSEFNVLRRTGAGDEKYSKVNNTLIYNKIGLATVPLYILDDKDCLKALINKKIPLRLEEDLRKLVSNSVVVRTDIANVKKQDRQLLARSNEIRDFEELQSWLYDQQSVLKKYRDAAFLFHIFVPAIGAAFVDASPMGRIVRIEALWGLPEGLYYNSHDSIVVDTKAIAIDSLSEKRVEVLSKKSSYKEFFVAPDSSGQWLQQRTKPPYDWKLCVDENTIRQISVESRKIANMAKQHVSVMWFLGIDKQYYGTSNLAWHHEEYSEAGHIEEYKKKYFFETETVIRNKKDYEDFLNSKTTRIVKICPVDDALLRDKSFIAKIGEAACEKGIPIMLSGTNLAHPLYQLCRTGAQVLTPKANSWAGEKAYYNKLVRDKIPNRIRNNGEEIRCQSLSKSALLRALMEKAVEEAIEIAGAQSEPALIEELGDEYEVLMYLRQLSQHVNSVDRIHEKNIVFPQAIHNRFSVFLSRDFDLTNKSSVVTIPLVKKQTIEIEVSYEESELQINLHFYRDPQKIIFSKHNVKHEAITENANIQQLFVEALSLSTNTNNSSIWTTAQNMKEVIRDIIQENNIDKSMLYKTMRAKHLRAGGFQKGYMLQSASLNYKKTEETIPIVLENNEPVFSETTKMVFKPKTNADYLDKGQGELVLRVSLPLCFNEYQTLFTTNRVKQYTENKEVLLVLKRESSTLHMCIKMENKAQTIEQLSWFDNSVL